MSETYSGSCILIFSYILNKKGERRSDRDYFSIESVRRPKNCCALKTLSDFESIFIYLSIILCYPL
jgi:hypothetical protein